MRLQNIIISIAIFLSTASVKANNNIPNIMKSREYLNGVIWGKSISSNDSLYPEIISKKNEHPLQISQLAVSYFFESIDQNNLDYRKKGEVLLKVLDNYPYKTEDKDSCIYLYNQDHGSLKAKKWWSAMANSSIALAYLYGYKITGKEQYKISALKALNGVTNPIQKNGSALKLNINSSWYLEYADANSNIENSKFVLNGFTFSLVVIKIFAETLHNPTYHKAYQRGIDGFKYLSKKFYYKDKNWNYYMLNPLTINSTHYEIIDYAEIYSLLMYDKENKTFLKEELKNRKAILKKNYNIEKYNKNKLLLSGIGAPSPYWIDTYPFNLKVNYKKDSNIKYKHFTMYPKDPSRNLSSRAFIKINDSNTINSVEVSIDYRNTKLPLFTTKIKDLKNLNGDNSSQVIINTTKVFSEDLIEDNNNTYIKLYKNKMSRAMIQYKIKEPIDLKKKKYFGILLSNSINLKAIRIVIIDIDEKSAERYYLPQKKGKNNLILLSPIGFNGYDGLNNKIKEVRFYLYGPKSNLTQANIKLSELFYMDSNIPLYNLLKNNDKQQHILNFQTK